MLHRRRNGALQKGRCTHGGFGTMYTRRGHQVQTLHKSTAVSPCDSTPAAIDTANALHIYCSLFTEVASLRTVQYNTLIHDRYRYRYRFIDSRRAP